MSPCSRNWHATSSPPSAMNMSRRAIEIRSLDANLPKPIVTEYPVYNDTGSVFLGMYDVASFVTWQTTPSRTCPYPPCLNPTAAAGSAAWHHQLLRERIQQHLQRHDHVAEAADESRDVLSKSGYTLAKAMDDGPDALVVGRPGNVQNSYATSLEWGPSVTDQRNRFVAAWVAEPKFRFSQAALNRADQQLEALQCLDRRLRPAAERHHGGRSEWRRQHLQRPPAGIHSQRIRRPRLLQYRHASHAQHPLRRTCAPGI